MLDLATVRRELLTGREKPRRYIGASGIGEECMAYQALSMRGFPGDMPSPQLLRIFGQGHSIEALVVRALIESGHKVEELDQSTGEQWEFTSHGGHHVCHLDGFITLLGSTEMMTLEIKSMNRKMFETFQKKGVKLSHPHYYDQCIDGLLLVRMADTGVDVSKCLLVAYCKDNSQYHIEIIEYDHVRAVDILSKVGQIVKQEDINRVGGYEHEFKCKGCFKRTSCWSPDVQDVGCHHCAHARANISGVGKSWWCTAKGGFATDVCPSFNLFRPEKKHG